MKGRTAGVAVAAVSVSGQKGKFSCVRIDVGRRLVKLLVLLLLLFALVLVTNGYSVLCASMEG